MISTSGHLISKFPEVRFHRTRISNNHVHDDKWIRKCVVCIRKYLDNSHMLSKDAAYKFGKPSPWFDRIENHLEKRVIQKRQGFPAGKKVNKAVKPFPVGRKSDIPRTCWRGMFKRMQDIIECRHGIRIICCMRTDDIYGIIIFRIDFFSCGIFQ